MPPKLPEHLGEYAARPAAQEDAPGAAACVRSAYEHYVARNGLVPVPMRQDYEEVIRDCQVTVVEHGGGIIAVLALAVTGEGFLLDNIAIAPAHQGKGLGRVLLEYAETEARRQGFDSIYLYTQEIMTENLALYRRIGYLEYARRAEFGLLSRLPAQAPVARRAGPAGRRAGAGARRLRFRGPPLAAPARRTGPSRGSARRCRTAR